MTKAGTAELMASVLGIDDAKQFTRTKTSWQAAVEFVNTASSTSIKSCGDMVEHIKTRGRELARKEARQKVEQQQQLRQVH